MTPVAQYLETARHAHRRYRAHGGRIDKQGKVAQSRDNQTATAAMTEALQARLDAEQADPLRVDAAWIEDERQMRATHDDLVAFYVRFLMPAEASA